MTKATLMTTTEMLVREALIDGLRPGDVVEVLSMIAATLRTFHTCPVFLDVPKRVAGSVA